jgi:NAD(P)-dependent dehydrogenase (short-subunit alcohol dehydrogenase family)
MLDLLFVNAGVTNEPEGTVAQTSTDEFVRVMVTNALAPLRVVEALQDRVEPGSSADGGRTAVFRRAERCDTDAVAAIRRRPTPVRTLGPS